MIKVFRICLISLFSFFSLVSCNDENDPSASEEVNQLSYEEFSSQLNRDFYGISTGLKSSRSNFSDKAIVTNVAEKYFGEESPALSAFLENYTNASESNGRTAHYTDMSDFQKQATTEIVDAIDDFSSLNEFQDFLDVKFESYVNMDLAEDEKNFIVLYILAYQSSLNFVDHNQDLFQVSSNDGRVQGWWDDWGKCAAGTIGGVLTGGLAGAGVGSVVPIIGTTAGGIVGAIGGGLTGAAASC